MYCVRNNKEIHFSFKNSEKQRTKALKNLKNTWKGIKSIISMKSFSSNSPILLTYQNDNIDNSERIANISNNYFRTIGEDTSKNKTFT